MFRHRMFIKRKRIVFYYCTILSLPNLNNINANISETIGNQLIIRNQGTKNGECMLSATITSNNMDAKYAIFSARFVLSKHHP